MALPRCRLQLTTSVSEYPLSRGCRVMVELIIAHKEKCTVYVEKMCLARNCFARRG